jgi:iron complex outermembrane receptor protein
LLPEKNNLNILFGINGMKQNARNRGTEYLIPEYDLFDAGVFVIIKKSFDKLDVSGGIRLDSRNENAEELFLDKNGKKTAALEADGSQKFKAFNSTFTGVSGSIGATYQFTEHIFSKINLSRGFRAPNISELAANGVHEGTIRYETGNPNLNAEHSLQLDLAFGLNLEHVSAEIDLFSNNISNYIFTQKLQSAYGGDSLTEAYNTFRFISGDAQLTGGEITFDIHPHPLDWLHFENSISIVQAVQKDQPDSTKYLPFTPATKFTSELKATSKKLGKNLANAYIKFGIEHYFKQDHFYAAWNTETETPAYTLINIGIGTDFIYKGQVLFSLYINGENLADRSYQSHLSRLKYATVNNATGRTGIYNMGRNISLKLQVPIHFNKNRK